MNKLKRTEITIETRQVVVTRRLDAGSLIEGPCEQCGAWASFATAEVAAGRRSLSVRDIYRHIEAGTVHFREVAGGAVLICLDSLR